MNDRKFTFLLDESNTPISQRIIKNICSILEKKGHRLVIKKASQHNYKEYIDSIRTKIDYCIVTNSVSMLSQFIPEINKYVFESVSSKIIFIHHDNSFRPNDQFEQVLSKIEAFVRNHDRIFHFCIEDFKVNDLRNLGLRAYKIAHATEFNNDVAINDFNYDVAFVGHLVPGNYHIPSFFKHRNISHQLALNYWQRIVDFKAKLEPSAIEYANKVLGNSIDKNKEFYAHKYCYLSDHSSAVFFFRGEVINRINYKQIDIFGGDPGYLHGGKGNIQIKKACIHYHPHTDDYSSTQNIYNKTKININITALQFDDAIINRVIDIGGAGGFLLTDYKEDLRNITSVYEEISYSSIEELNAKISYYLSNEEARIEIARAFQDDILKNCTYDKIITNILSEIRKPCTTPDILRIDLGSGPRKPKGFIGIDKSDWPGVDVIADITKRFPYPDSSVEEVRAHNIIEHLPDNIHTMNEIWRICKSGARVDIRVPSTDGRGAFQDPTHVSFWNINSFKYYSKFYHSYFELCRDYGFIGEFEILSIEQEETDEQVYQINAILKVVK